MSILTLNLLFSTFIFWVVVKIYILPRLNTLAPRTILLPVLFLHSFRHLGLMFLEPGAVYPGMPQQFAVPAAYGDLLASILALAAIPAVAANKKIGFTLLWIFNIEGSLDLIAAIALATVYDASAYMGPAYWIPAFWVPALLVTHYLVFVILLKKPDK